MSARREDFAAPWPGVLIEMKDYLDLTFLALGGARRGATVRVFISRSLVPRAELQPHAARFRASLARIPDCRVEFKATDDAAHRIEIETGK